MEGAMELPKGMFSEQLKHTHEKISDTIEKKYEETMFQIMKTYLEQNGIKYGVEVKNCDDLRKNVISKLSDAQRDQINSFEKNVRSEIQSVTAALKSGSQSAFSSFAEKSLGVGKFALSAVVKSIAIGTAMELSPLLAGIGVGASIAVPGVVNGVKKYKEAKVERETDVLKALLIKVSLREREDKKVEVDIPDDVINKICEQLKNEGINVNKENKVKFLTDILGLDNEKKTRALTIINEERAERTGDRIDIEAEKKKYIDSYDKIKNSVKEIVSIISTAALVGSNIGNTVNDLAGAEVASVITGLTAGSISGNAGIALGIGGAQYALSKFGNLIPFVGDTIAGTLGKINTGINIGTGVLVATSFSLVFKVLPYVYKQIKASIEEKKKIEDAPKVDALRDKTENIGDKIERKIQLTEDCIRSKNPREIALGIVADSMRMKGIELPYRNYTNEELKEHAKLLSEDDKKDILEVSNVLAKINSQEPKTALNTLKKIGKWSYWGGVLALAGLGIYSIFDPSILESIKQKDFLQELFGKKKEEMAQEQVVGQTGKADPELVAQTTGTISNGEVAEQLVAESQEQQAQIAEELRQYLPAQSYSEIPGMNLSVFSNVSDTATPQEVEIGRKVYELLGVLPSGEITDLSTQVNTEKLSNLIYNYFQQNGTQPNFALFEEFGLADSFGSFQGKSMEEICRLFAESDYVKKYIIDTAGLNHELYSQLQPEMLYVFDNFTMPGLLNNAAGQLLSDMPTQIATTEELMAYIESLKNDELKRKLMDFYLMESGKSQNWLDLIGSITGKYNELATQAVTEVVEQAQLQQLYKAAPKILEDNKIPKTTLEIVGTGAAIGTGAGFFATFGKKIKDGFKKLFGKKQKELPESKESHGEKNLGRNSAQDNRMDSYIKASVDPQEAVKQTIEAEKTNIGEDHTHDDEQK